ncbi:MAG: 3-deoxy-manno-octulosonate cytidylyltransferase [Cytophagales bacterium]
MSTKKIVAIIPARYGSTRFPGKPLVDIAGKSLINRVYDQCCKSKLLTKVVVATDDERIFNHVKDFGGNVVMTSSEHPTGTDRCVEAYLNLNEKFDVILNIQGDEPFVDPQQIDELIQIFRINENAEIGTLVKKITDPNEIHDPKEAKVVFNSHNQVLLMSRSAIPFVKGISPNEWIHHYNYYKHIGIYGFAEQTLLKLGNLPQTELEKVESLEQLRWLDNYKMYVGFTDIDTLSIDTPEDLLEVPKYI